MEIFTKCQVSLLQTQTPCHFALIKCMERCNFINKKFKSQERCDFKYEDVGEAWATLLVPRRKDQEGGCSLCETSEQSGKHMYVHT